MLIEIPDYDNTIETLKSQISVLEELIKEQTKLITEQNDVIKKHDEVFYDVIGTYDEKLHIILEELPKIMLDAIETRSTDNLLKWLNNNVSKVKSELTGTTAEKIEKSDKAVYPIETGYITPKQVPRKLHELDKLLCLSQRNEKRDST